MSEIISKNWDFLKVLSESSSNVYRIIIKENPSVRSAIKEIAHNILMLSFDLGEHIKYFQKQSKILEEIVEKDNLAVYFKNIPLIQLCIQIAIEHLNGEVLCNT